LRVSVVYLKETISQYFQSLSYGKLERKIKTKISFKIIIK